MTGRPPALLLCNAAAAHLRWGGGGGNQSQRQARLRAATTSSAGAAPPSSSPSSSSPSRMRPDAPIADRFAGRTVVVQGASRGLGLEIVRQLLGLPRPPRAVFATCRDPSRAHDLRALLASSSSSSGAAVLTVLPLDVTDPVSIERAAADVAAATAAGAGDAAVDVLFNTSGVLHDRARGLAPETSVSRVGAESLAAMFAVNATGPLLVAQAFLPLLARSAAAAATAAAAEGREGAGAPPPPPAIIATLSARVGSIDDNRLGGWYSYRASKAALNQLYRTLSIEVGRRYNGKAGAAGAGAAGGGGGGGGGGGIACVLMHPGSCDTSLTKPYQANIPTEKLFTAERGARGLLGMAASATAAADNGRFVDWAGETVPW